MTNVKIFPSLYTTGNVTVCQTDHNGVQKKYSYKNNACIRLLNGLCNFLASSFALPNTYGAQTAYIPKYLQVGTGTPTSSDNLFARTGLVQPISVGSPFNVFVSDITLATSEVGISSVTFVSFIQPGTITEGTTITEMALFGSVYSTASDTCLAYVSLTTPIIVKNDASVQVQWKISFSNSPQ